MNNSNSIVGWRVFFSYVIITYHFLNAYGYGSSLYLATDFFFIVSGFLLAKDAHEEKFENAMVMLIHKVKKFYPHYLLSLVIGCIVLKCFYIGSNIGVNEIIPELTLIQMIGINPTQMINVPTWYLSVLLICSYFIYFLLQNYKKIFVSLIIPVILIIGGTWFYRNYGYLSHKSLGEGLTSGVYWNQPLLLGFMMICLGILCFEMYNVPPKNYILSKKSTRVVEIVIFSGVMVFALIYRKCAFDFVAIIFMCIAICLAFLNGESVICKNGFVRYLSRLSYPLYLNHNMFRLLYPQYIKEFTLGGYLSYIIIVTMYSMLTMLAVEKYVKFIQTRKEKRNGKNNYSSGAGKG